MAGGPSSRPEGRKTEGWKTGTGRSIWEMMEPSPETVAELMRRFPNVLQLPEEDIRSRSDAWLATGVVAKTLGRRVSTEAAVRELRLRGGLKGDVNGYPIDERYMAFRFSETEDRDRLLLRPWTVNGQPMAMERWQPRFSPASSEIRSAVVWVRLPGLPVEYWGEETIRHIVEPAGELLSLDDCTVYHRRLGFARAAIRISLSVPLRPGVIIGYPEGRRWQQFVYENLRGVCLNCGLFHGESGCRSAEGSATTELRPENFAGDNGEEAGGPGRHQELGPWIAAVRRWLPPEPKDKPERRADQKMDRAPVSPRRPEVAAGKKPLVFGTAPVGDQGVEGWAKPTKVARRRSPDPALGTGVVHDGVQNPFALLSGVGEKTEARGELAHPKRARSPVNNVGPLRGRKAAQPMLKPIKGKARSVGHFSGQGPGLSESEHGEFRFSAGGSKAGSSSSSSSGVPMDPGPSVFRDAG